MIVEESGLDQETFSRITPLLEHTENPYIASISLDFRRLRDGWILSQINTQHYAAGALPTEPRSVN